MSKSTLEVLLTENEDLSLYRLFIWGTGNTACLYHEGLSRLEKEGIEIDGYCDNNPSMWGTEFFGKKVYSPSEIYEMRNIMVLLATPKPSAIRALKKQLSEAKIKCRHIDDFILKKFRESVLEAYDALEDVFSKDTYEHVICCRLLGKYPDDKYVTQGQYFTYKDFGDYDENEVYIDCGAFVGDTIEQYIWNKEGTFKKIIAFEPDENNLRAMNYRIERLKREWNIDDDRIVVYPYGLGNETSVNYVEHYKGNNGFGSKLSDKKTVNAAECKIVTIDEIVNEKYSFLKADIESYEYKMLLGAEKSIKMYSPKLAICIYHNVIDLFQIPLLIKRMNPKYKLAIRQHLHLLSDTVLYAYVDEDMD